MSDLDNIEELDLSNNLLHDVNLDIVSLKTLPNLKKLIYPVKKQKQMMVVENLKKLTYFNSSKVTRNLEVQSYKFKYMNKENMAALRKQLNSHFKKIMHFQSTYLDDVDPANQEKFDSENVQIINDSLNRINNSSDEVTENLELIIATITKFELYDNLKQRTLNICMDIYGDLGKFIREISDTQDTIFKALAQQALKLSKYEYEILQIEKEKRQNSASLEAKIFQKNFRIQKQLKRMKKQKDQYLSQINNLQSQNKRYLDMLVKYSRGQKNSFAGLHMPSSHSTKNHASIPTNIIKPPERNPPKHYHQPSATVPSHNIGHSTSNYYSSSSRTLTLKQLKDTVEQIYQSKLKFDQKNFDGKIARETMHQYLFTYLNQKYGLKNLTIQAASSIISAIQAYSIEDNDIAVFGKILRNQIDQEFRNVQTQLKTTINSLLKMHIKSQQPYKSASEINDLFNEKINNQITAQEAGDIVRYLYNKADADRIMTKVDMLFKLSKPKQEHTHRRVIPRQQPPEQKGKLKIKFSVFLKAVLDFQLKNHERLLKPLVRVFKIKDRDSDGIINEEQFIYVIEQLCEEANDILPDLLMIVDPYETKSITFTQIVRLVANYPENNPILSRFMQQKQGSDDEDV